MTPLINALINFGAAGICAALMFWLVVYLLKFVERILDKYQTLSNAITALTLEVQKLRDERK